MHSAASVITPSLPSDTVVPAEELAPDPAIRRRWAIVILLFVASAINYLDRQTLSVLGPTLRQQLHLTDHDYANAVSAFLLSYAIMYTLAGRWIDRVGARVGMVACIAWWSIATMLTAFARGAMSLAGVRFLLGIGEPGVFPAGLKTCGDLFPARERALPVGVFSSGASVGAILAPPLIAWVTISFGWRAAFLIPGIVGLLWIPLWLTIYRKPSPELAAMQAKQAAATRRPWLEIIKQRKVWGLILARAASDPVWYFYLFWLPDFLQRDRGLSLTQIGLFAWIPYVFADLGNVCGGSFTDWLIRRGWSAPRARFAALAVVALLAPFGAFVGFAHGPAQVIAVACLIAFLCQVWSCNTATLATDLAGSDERATLLGMMGTSGSLGGILFSQLLAIVIAWKGYPAAFVLAALLHPIGILLLFCFLKPTLQQSKGSIDDQQIESI